MARPFRRQSDFYGDVVFRGVDEALVLVGVGIWGVSVVGGGRACPRVSVGQEEEGSRPGSWG